MSYQTLEVAVSADGVARVALNAPDKRNALSALMIAELTDLAGTLGQGGARVIVLSGSGKVFCAGGDLAWMQAQIVADRATRMAEARKLAMLLQALNTMSVPLIGRIHGGAFGGGIGIACVCDLAIAGASAQFGLTETRLGLIPAIISPYVIARMGEGRARQVFMSGRVFAANEALGLGIVARVVPDESLDQAVEAETRHYLAAAPGAVSRTKALVRSLGPRIDAEVIDATIRHLADAWETDEAAQGIAAFMEKRAADWSL